MSELVFKNISKSFDGQSVIKAFDLAVPDGEFLVLLGPSGCGKSTLLRMIAGLESVGNGDILIDGQSVIALAPRERDVAMVFQNYALYPHMTVYDNIAYPLRTGSTKSQIPNRVSKLAEDFGVTDLLRRKPQTLSGGESQRVSLARAVASEPDCLLLDEPLSSLDAKSRPQMRALLRKINAKGQTIIHVTHDYTEAVSLSTHIAVIEEGIIAQTGAVEDVFQHPKSEFIARFIGIRNFFNGRLEASNHQAGLKQFRTGGFAFSVLTDSPAGAGFVCIRSEDVTILNSNAIAEPTSARNNFEGTIVDIVRDGLGVEVIVNIGIDKQKTASGNNLEIAALITSESIQEMNLSCGKKVCLSFKASAVKYVEE